MLDDIKWLAGVFDVRGSWYWRDKRCKNRYPRIEFHNPDEYLVIAVADVLGNSVREVETKWSDNPMFMTSVDGRRAHGILMSVVGAMRNERRKNHLMAFLREVALA